MKDLGIAILAAGFLMAGSAAAGPIFKYGGKSYEAKDLPPAMQQSHYELELENYLKLESFVNNAVVDLHVQEVMQKSGKTKAQVENDLFKVDEPSKKEIEEWYNANKNRLPPGYKLEQIEDNIKMVLKNEGQNKAREKLVASLTKSKGAAFLLEKPQAPKVEIASAGFPSKGSDKAKVTIVEFADYQCPHCKSAGPEIKEAMKKFDGKVKVVFMDFPINQSGISEKVAHGAVCAQKQDKFWEYHEMAFEKQRELTAESPAQLAKDVGLNIKAFDTCYASDEPKQQVAKAKEEGERIGVAGTPAIFVNGRRVHGYGQEELTQAIEAALKGAAS